MFNYSRDAVPTARLFYFLKPIVKHNLYDISFLRKLTVSPHQSKGLACLQACRQACQVSVQEQGWRGQEAGEWISSRSRQLENSTGDGEKVRVDTYRSRGAVRWVQRIQRNHRNQLKPKSSLEDIWEYYIIFLQIFQIFLAVKSCGWVREGDSWSLTSFDEDSVANSYLLIIN